MHVWCLEYCLAESKHWIYVTYCPFILPFKSYFQKGSNLPATKYTEIQDWESPGSSMKGSPTCTGEMGVNKSLWYAVGREVMFCRWQHMSEGTQREKHLTPSWSRELGRSLREGDIWVMFRRMRGKLTAGKVSYSRGKGLWKGMGPCRACVLIWRSSHGSSPEGSARGWSFKEELPELFRRAWLPLMACTREENNVILDVGSRIPLRERIVLVWKQALMGLLEHAWRPRGHCRNEFGVQQGEWTEE